MKICVCVGDFTSSLSLCRYWGRSEETAAAFTADGWFKTGDVAGEHSHGACMVWHVIVTCSNQHIDQAGTTSLAEHQQTSSSVEDSNLGQCEAVVVRRSTWSVLLVFSASHVNLPVP